MNVRLSILNLLIAGFLFFRYLRANKGAVVLAGNFIFIGLAIYEIRQNVVYLLVMCTVLVLEIYIIFLKANKNPHVLKIHEGYKPEETVLHYIIFGLIAFVVYIAMKYIR